MTPDLTALMEDLRTLGDAVPLLTKHMQDARHEAETLRSAAQELQHDVEAAKGEAATHLAAIKDALPSLVEKLGTDEAQLKDAESTLADAWATADPVFTSSGDPVLKAADEVVAHALDLHHAIDEARTKVEDAKAVGEAVLSRLEHDAEDAQQRIHAALQALKSEVDAFQTFAHASTQSIVAAAQALAQRVVAVSTEVESGAQEALETLRTKTDEEKQAAHDVVSALAEHLMEKVDEADGHIDQAITAPLGRSEELLRIDLEQLEASADLEQALSAPSHELDTALGQLKTGAERIPAGISQIDAAGRQVGV